MNIKEIITDEYKLNGLTIIVSIICVILSFFRISLFFIDLSWVAILLCGLPILYEAFIGLLNRDIKADVLVSMGIISSILIGEVFAAGVISVIMAIGGFLEDYTVKKTEEGIENIYNLNPINCRIILKYNTGNEKEVLTEVESIEIGDILKVLPGETIPVDGKVIQGATTVDESPLTGEPIPKDKKADSKVYSGTINTYGAFYMKALKVGKDSSIQKLINLIENARPEKAHIVRQADKWATWIVIIAFSLAVFTWFVTGQVIRAVTILVVFCPCGLVLATPTAIVAANGNLTKYGVLVRNGEIMEKLSKVKNIAFDKTGTLTYGKPEVIDIIPYNISSSELLKLAASVENNSEHPIGKAIVKKYKLNNFYKVEGFKLVVGGGVSAKILSKEVRLGNKSFIEQNTLVPKDFNLNDMEDNGSTIIYASYNNVFIGSIILHDVLRADSKYVINELKSDDINPIMLTGDNEFTGKYIASQLGINRYKTNCMPEDKINIIGEYEKEGKMIAFVGDGLNDGPALKKADVGIAMGGIGSDITISASDITLINDDIKYIPHLMNIARATMNKININIAISLTINFAAMFLAMFGIIGPVVGALIHNLGSVIVVVNSSLLLNYKTKSVITIDNLKFNKEKQLKVKNRI